MKRNYILTFLLLIVISPLSSIIAQDISLSEINKKEVEKHAQAIEHELWHNAWHKRLTIIAGLCAATYGTYYFLKNPSPSIALATASALSTGTVQGQLPTETSKEVTNNDLKKLINELGDRIESQALDKAYVKQITDFMNEQRKKQDSGFTGTLKTWGKTTLNFVVREAAVAVAFSAVIGSFGKYFKMIDTTIDSVLYKVFHPGNLQWYITTHTNIYTLLNDLEGHAYCIEHKRLPKKATNDGTVQAEIMLTEDQVAYRMQAFATTWSLCVKELESILGFMSMKAQYTCKQAAVESPSLLLAQRYAQITEHIYQLAEDFCLKAHDLLRTDITMRSGLAQAVNRLRLLFMEERSAFTTCEEA